jgi:imidazolonepropionase-like amidohydrolase
MDIEAFRRRPVRISVGRLIDATSDELLEEPSAVLVVDGRVAAVGPDERVPRPDDAQAFEFPGATALPGLIDGHVHVTLPPTVDPLATMDAESDEQLVARGAVAAERMVRAGVTTAVDLGARGTTGFRVREVIEREIGLGPRLLVAGRPVTPTGGHCRFFGGEADGVDGVRAAIRRLIEDEGADIIKMMATGGGLTPGTDSRQAAYDTEVLRAAVEETHRLGRRITTHAHGVPGIRRATEASVDVIQHCTMLGPNWEWTFDEDVARLMVERGTRAVPTISAGTRFEVEAGVDINKLQPNPGAMTRADWWANARSLHEAGVTIVPGTDVGVNLTDFGEELFFELEAYVGWGLSPLATIRKATAVSAWSLGLDDVTGTLRTGLAGDVLVVDGQPDRDISALRKPLLVLRGGRPIQPTPPPPAPVRRGAAAPA